MFQEKLIEVLYELLVHAFQKIYRFSDTNVSRIVFREGTMDLSRDRLILELDTTTVSSE
jgi:hypothetical protein